MSALRFVCSRCKRWSSAPLCPTCAGLRKWRKGLRTQARLEREAERTAIFPWEKGPDPRIKPF